MSFLNHNLKILPLEIYIDPQFPVEKAIITHAHADHAKPGHKKVLATKETIEIMKIRYGNDCANSFQILEYGKKLSINNLTITLFPAGHIIGSAQVLIEMRGKKVLVTGDYKTKKDSTTLPFEIIPCNTLVTEATFGLPVFQHPDPNYEIKKLLNSVTKNTGCTHLVGVYALGKAQRIIKLLRENNYNEIVYIHGALEKICDYYGANGINLGKFEKVLLKNKKNYQNKIVLAPPSAIKEKWSRRFSNKITSQASGWMCIKQRVKQNLVEVPMIISDHADWDELTSTIKLSGAENIWITHGRDDGLMYWCKSQGLNAQPLSFLDGKE